MGNRYLLVALLLGSLLSAGAEAQVFKCVAANGELTFSQTPCVEKDSKVTVQKSVSSSSGDAAECQHAHRFALDTARKMKAGTDSSTLFDRYGGLSALSKGSVSLISYVFQFRTNNDVSAERVAALSMAKCQARSFGDVSCERLPVGFTSKLGGCELDDEEGGSPDVPYLREAPQQFSLQSNSSSQDSAAALQARNRETKAREQEKQLQCKQRIRDKIDSINSQLRAGYSGSTGERLRKRRRDLEQQMREC